MPPALPRRLEAVILPALAAVALVGVWSLAVARTGTRVFPPPMAVARGVLELWRRGVLLRYALDSLGRVGAGFGLATLLGAPLGGAMASVPTLAAALDPVVQFLRPISPLAWIPLVVLAFGVGSGAAIALIFLATLFPIVLAAYDAVRGVPGIYLQLARNFGLSPVATFVRVVVPAALPRLLAGLRLALGVGWMVVVAAEMIAVDSGLGYLILDARNAGKRYDLVVAGMVLIGLIGLALDLLARALERHPALRGGTREDE